MNYKNLFLILILFSLLPCQKSFAAEDAIKTKMADFFNVSPERIYIECPQNSYRFSEEEGQETLNFCLHKLDQNKRCEVSISNLGRSPEINRISYDIKVADVTPRKLWQSVMQIHSFPDEGEKWRCPVMSLEVVNGTFRSFNRWDASPVSRTLGYNCAEAGSSISSRPVLNDVAVKPGHWQKVELTSKLSIEEGELLLKIDGKGSGSLEGPNIFNDKKPPFLKFGIYKPTGFEKGHVESCVKYKNVKILTDKN